MELFEDRPGDDGLAARERAPAMVALMMATAMVVFDGSVINIALPQMATELQVAPQMAVWFANGYLLSAAMTLAIFAALARRLGFRPIFLSGLAVFTLTSVGCSLAPDAPVLVIMRVLQGLGGAAVVSIGPAILRSVFPSRLLGSILGLNALLIAASTAIAPIIGGALLDAWGWRWIFVLNVVPGLAALGLAAGFVRDLQARTRAPLDAMGSVLSAVLVGALVLATDQAGQPSGSWYAVLAALASVGFIRHLLSSDKPLLPPAMFKSVRFSVAALTSMTAFVGQSMTFIALPFLLQRAYGYSALETALLFVPWPVGIVLVAPHAGRYADRYSPVVISTLGLVVLVAALAALALLPSGAGVWAIAACCFFCGVGFGIFQSPNNREMLSNVSREHSSYASGVLAIMRTFGQCLGAAIVGILLDASGQGAAQATVLRSVQGSLWVAVSATLLATVFSLVRVRAGRPVAQPRSGRDHAAAPTIFR